MKPRRGQAAPIFLEALHQLGRIATLLVLLALAVLGGLAYRLSQGPLNIPVLASKAATLVSGEGITVQIGAAELAWAGWQQGGGVPLSLDLANITVRSESGVTLAQVPGAALDFPLGDLFGDRTPIRLSGTGASFPDISAPVSWYALLTPGGGVTLARGVVYATLGAGTLGAGDSQVALQAASFTLVATPNAVEIGNGQAALQPFGQSAPHLTFALHAHRENLGLPAQDESLGPHTQDAGIWLGRLDAAMDASQAADLHAFWPAGLLPLTRTWVTTNITGGRAQNAQFSFSLSANGDLSHARLQNVAGSFQAQDVTLGWLQGAIPITHLNGSFTMPGMDTIVIDADHGMLGNIQLGPGRMYIDDLNTHLQTGELAVQFQSRVQDVIAVLQAPPLALLTKGPPEVTAATGQTTGNLTLVIPFKKRIAFDDVTLQVQAALQDVEMPTPLAGLRLTAGQGQLTTNGHTLQAAAQLRFAGEPASLKVQADFAASPGGSETLDMQGIAGPALWQAFGITADDSTDLHGLAPYSFHLDGPAEGTQAARTSLDLTQAALALPVLGWSKPAGAPGAASLSFTLAQGNFATLQSLSANAPGLLLDGSGQGRVFTLHQARIGRTSLAGTLTAPAHDEAPWQVALTGAALEIHHGSTAEVTKAAPPQPPSGPLWQARLAVDNLYLSDAPAPGLAAFSLAASGQGSSLSQAQAKATGFALSITPTPAGRKQLAVQDQDTGTLLQILGAYDGLRGGTLDLAATYGGGQPASGTAKLTNLRLVKAPGITKLLQAATLYGVAEAVSGPGLLIDRASFPFTLNAGILTLHGADAFSASLGFTASGTYDSATSQCDLDTTIVPAYALNALPGKIPLIGKLFAPEKGGGLFAMRAHVTGPLGNPDIHLNPLSALTPGFLRGLFGIGEH